MEKEQLSEEIQNARTAFKRSEQDWQQQTKIYEARVSSLQIEVEELRGQNGALQDNINNIRDEKDEIDEELDEKSKEYNYVREQF